jgi:indole-3-glycerol phosphate synthase
VALGPECIGVNARDLDTFHVDLDAARAVLRRVPAAVIAVAESGIVTRDDAERVATDGADAILVGTALAGAPDPAAAVRRLVGVPRARDARRESR